MGTIRSISVPGNPIPFAVGTMAVSSTEAAREGMKGRGVTLLHSWGDLLWALGPKIPPNEGFMSSRIYPMQGEMQNSRDEVDENEIEGDGGGDYEEGNARKEESSAVGAGSSTAAAVGEKLEGLSLGADDTNMIGSTSIAGIASKDVISNNNGVAPAAEGVQKISGLDMDTLLEAAVLGGLRSLKNAELPIQTSDFYQKHMLPLRPDGITFDFKTSTKYKKLSKLLDKYEKDKVLTQKQIRKQDHISSVNRSHPLIVHAADASAAGAAGGGGGAPMRDATGKKSAAIEYLYRAPSSLRAVFGPEGLANKDALYTAGEVEEALNNYATEQLLLSPDKKHIKLDHLLASGLWGKKEGPEEGSTLPIKQLLERYLSKLQLFHKIERPTEGGMVLEVVRKGAVKSITILAEKRFGRNVTVVAHVESFGYVADEMASDFQWRFKTACSVSKLPGKTESDFEIMMQGDLAKKVAEYFTLSDGIEAKFVEVNNKLSGKKK